MTKNHQFLYVYLIVHNFESLCFPPIGEVLKVINQSGQDHNRHWMKISSENPLSIFCDWERQL